MRFGIRGERVETSARRGDALHRPRRTAGAAADVARRVPHESARSRRAPSSACGASPSSHRRPPTSKNRSPRSLAAGLAPRFSTTRSTRSSPASTRATRSGSRRRRVSAHPCARAEVRQPHSRSGQGGAGTPAERAEAAAHAGGSFSFRNGMQTLTDALARAVGARHARRERRANGAIRRWPMDPDRHPRTARPLGPAGAERRACGSGARGGHARARACAGCGAGARGDTVRAARHRRHRLPGAPTSRISLAGFGFLVPKREQRKILGSLFSSSMFEGRAPADTALLTSFVGGMRHPELAAMPDAELAAVVHGELQALIGASGRRCGPRSPAGATRFRNTISAIASGCARWRTPSAHCPASGSAPTIAAAFRSAIASQAARAMAETIARFVGAAQ